MKHVSRFMTPAAKRAMDEVSRVEAALGALNANDPWTAGTVFRALKTPPTPPMWKMPPPKPGAADNEPNAHPVRDEGVACDACKGAIVLPQRFRKWAP